MAFWVYILRCRDGAYYVGHTNGLDQRVAQHQSGEVGGYTARRLPLELVYSQDFSTRYEAFEAERQLKGWSRAKKEALISARHTYFEQVEAVINVCELEGVEAWLLADFFRTQFSRTTFDDFTGSR